MARTNARLESARGAYRQALDDARANPTPEAWTRLLAAGKELSAAQDSGKGSRRPRRGAAVVPENTGASEGPDLGEGSLGLEPTLE